MGKWAQYKRRGSPGAASGAALHPPAPPRLFTQGGEVFSEDLGPYNEGGMSRLFRSDDGSAPWTQVNSQDWDIDADWGTVVSLGGYFYRATSVGNHINFEGESIPSNVLDLA